MKDLASGKELLKKPIPDTAGNVAWASDNRTLFYVTKDKLDRWGGAVSLPPLLEAPSLGTPADLTNPQTPNKPLSQALPTLPVCVYRTVNPPPNSHLQALQGVAPRGRQRPV